MKAPCVLLLGELEQGCGNASQTVFFFCLNLCWCLNVGMMSCQYTAWWTVESMYDVPSCGLLSRYHVLWTVESLWVRCHVFQAVESMSVWCHVLWTVESINVSLTSCLVDCWGNVSMMSCLIDCTVNVSMTSCLLFQRTFQFFFFLCFLLIFAL